MTLDKGVSVESNKHRSILPHFLDFNDFCPATGGTETLDGNVEKAVFVDSSGARYFVKRYHSLLQNRDAVLEFLGQCMAMRAGFEAAQTFLFENMPHCMASRDFLRKGERILTLRSLKLTSQEPLGIVKCFRQWSQDPALGVKILLFDALLQNLGRHTGNLALICNAEGEILRSAPVFDTVAFDNTRLIEAVKNKKSRWLQMGTSSGLELEDLGNALKQVAPDFDFKLTLVTQQAAILEVLQVALEECLISLQEFEFMLILLEHSFSALAKST